MLKVQLEYLVVRSAAPAVEGPFGSGVVAVAVVGTGSPGRQLYESVVWTKPDHQCWCCLEEPPTARILLKYQF